MCVCVCVRERESRDTRNLDTENTQVNVLTKEKDPTTYKVGGGCFIESPSLFIKSKTHQHGE